jgi:hypothetical protein
VRQRPWRSRWTDGRVRIVEDGDLTGRVVKTLPGEVCGFSTCVPLDVPEVEVTAPARHLITNRQHFACGGDNRLSVVVPRRARRPQHRVAPPHSVARNEQTVAIQYQDATHQCIHAIAAARRVWVAHHRTVHRAGRRSARGESARNDSDDEHSLRTPTKGERSTGRMSTCDHSTIIVPHRPGDERSLARPMAAARARPDL